MNLNLEKEPQLIRKDNEELLENYRKSDIYDRLYNRQFGFRKNHSKSHALNVSIDRIKTAISYGDHVIEIFIDLSKAFDTIDHNIL